MASENHNQEESVRRAKDDTANPDQHKFSILELHGYRVGRSIGKGSYATVREAYSQRHRSKVAIKVISKKKAPGDYLQKFLPREIEVVKILRHPHLILFMQCIETTNRVYLVMEHASGGDLLDVVRNRKYIQEPQAATWFSQLLAGTEYTHNQGVVHRDLKCENVLLDNHGNLKITDFGFARAGMKPVNGKVPLSETYCGSYAYAPPEILTGTPYVAQMADIWSLGVILYVMVFGRLPFDDSNHRELLRQVRRGPVFPDKRPVSLDCKSLLNKILTRREDRWSIPQMRQGPWYKRLVTTEPKGISSRNLLDKLSHHRSSSHSSKVSTSSADSKKRASSGHESSAYYTAVESVIESNMTVGEQSLITATPVIQTILPSTAAVVPPSDQATQPDNTVMRIFSQH